MNTKKIHNVNSGIHVYIANYCTVSSIAVWYVGHRF